MNPAKKQKSKKNNKKTESGKAEPTELDANALSLQTAEMLKKLMSFNKVESNEELIRKLDETKPYTDKINEVNDRVNQIIEKVDKMCEKVLDYKFEGLESSEPVQKNRDLEEIKTISNPVMEKRKEELVKTITLKIDVNQKQMDYFEKVANFVGENSVISKKKILFLNLLNQEKLANEKLLAIISAEKV